MPRVAAKAQKKKPVCDTKPALEEGVSFDDVHTWFSSLLVLQVFFSAGAHPQEDTATGTS
jgi:hypothetical protein